MINLLGIIAIILLIQFVIFQAKKAIEEGFFDFFDFN